MLTDTIDRGRGIPQLHRFAFLRALWSHVVDTAQAKWVQATIDQAKQARDEPA